MAESRKEGCAGLSKSTHAFLHLDALCLQSWFAVKTIETQVKWAQCLLFARFLELAGRKSEQQTHLPIEELTRLLSGFLLRPSACYATR